MQCARKKVKTRVRDFKVFIEKNKKVKTRDFDFGGGARGTERGRFVVDYLNKIKSSSYRVNYTSTP